MRRSIFGLVCFLYIAVAFSPEPSDTTPKNETYLPPVTWEGYGVDWMFRSLRIGTTFADSLMADGWIGAYGGVFDTVYAENYANLDLDTLKLPFEYADDVWLDKTAEASTGAGPWGSMNGMGFQLKSTKVITGVTAYVTTPAGAVPIYWKFMAADTYAYPLGYAGEPPDGSVPVIVPYHVRSDTISVGGTAVETTWTFPEPIVLSPGVYFFYAFSMSQFTLDQANHRPTPIEAWGFSALYGAPYSTGSDFRIKLFSEEGEHYQYIAFTESAYAPKGPAGVFVGGDYSWFHSRYMNVYDLTAHDIRGMGSDRIRVYAPFWVSGEFRALEGTQMTGGATIDTLEVTTNIVSDSVWTRSLAADVLDIGSTIDTLLFSGGDTLFVKGGVIQSFVQGSP